MNNKRAKKPLKIESTTPKRKIKIPAKIGPKIGIKSKIPAKKERERGYLIFKAKRET